MLKVTRTRNHEPETRNHKPETRNQKPQTTNLTDPPIDDVDNPVCQRGILRIVTHHKHRLPLRVHLQEHFHYFASSFCVERSGRFISKHQRRLVDYRPSDCQAALLAA